MDLRRLSTHGLLMLYQSVKLALEEDDKAPEAPPFEVRSNPDWRTWSDEIGALLSERGTDFKPIQWQTKNEQDENETGRRPEGDSDLGSGHLGAPETVPSDELGEKTNG